MCFPLSPWSCLCLSFLQLLVWVSDCFLGLGAFLFITGHIYGACGVIVCHMLFLLLLCLSFFFWGWGWRVGEGKFGSSPSNLASYDLIKSVLSFASPCSPLSNFPVFPSYKFTGSLLLLFGAIPVLL